MVLNLTRKRRVGVGIAAMLAVGALLASCASGDSGSTGNGDDAAASEPIRIGALFPTSGELALLGDESWRGVQLAEEEINANGGINGRPVEIVKADVPDVNAATSEARRLLDVEDVQLVIGTYSSGLALAGSEIYARGGGTYVEAGAIAMDFNTRGYEGVFRVNPNAEALAAAQIEFLQSWVAEEMNKPVGELNVMMVHEDSSYGSSLARTFETLAQAEGIDGFTALPYSAAATDLTSTVLNIGQADPDVVIAVSYLSDAILLSRQMVENGVQVPVFMGSGGGHTIAEYGDTLGDIADYVFDTAYPQFNLNKDGAPGLDDFVAAYEAKFNSAPASGHSLSHYVGAMVIFDILAETDGDTSREAFGEAAMALDIPEGGGTANGWGVKFDETGQNERARYFITQWRDGVSQTVWPESVAVLAPELAPVG